MPTLDKGYYWGNIIDFGTAKTEKGTPYFYLTCNVVSVWCGANYVDIPVVERTVFIYLSDAAMEYSAPKLASIGFNGDFASPDIGDDAKDDGVRLENDPETYEGKEREKWQLHTKRALEHKPVDNNEIRRLNALYRNTMSAEPAKPSVAPPTAAPSMAGGPDDPPF